VIFSAILGLLFVYLGLTRKSGKMIGSTVIMIVLINGLGFGGWTVVESINNLIIGERRDITNQNILSNSSILTRAGAGLRGMEVFIYSPVVGVGPGNIVAFMTSDVVPRYLDMSNKASLTRVYYNYIANGEHATGPHNLYIRLLEEYGIIALLVCILAAHVLIFRFRKFSSRYRNSRVKLHDSLFTMIFVAYAMLFSFSLYYTVQHTPLFYNVVAMLVWLTCMDPRECNGRTTIRRGGR